MEKLFPVGTLVHDSGHGFGKITELRDTRPAWTNEEFNDKLEQAKSIGPKAVDLTTMAGILSSAYCSSKYPYRIKFEPNPSQAKKYPGYEHKFLDGYEDVYGPEGMMFSFNGRHWLAYAFTGEFIDSFTVADKNDRSEIVEQREVLYANYYRRQCEHVPVRTPA